MNHLLCLNEQSSSEPKTIASQPPLRIFVAQAMKNYFAQIDAELPPRQLYQMVMEEVELPLLQVTLEFANGNQSKASELLGLSRTTLRKKLKQHGLDEKI